MKIYKITAKSVNAICQSRLAVKLFFRRNATHCISPYAIVMCVCVCVCLYVCVCMCAAFVDLRKTVCYRDAVFLLNCSE